MHDSELQSLSDSVLAIDTESVGSESDNDDGATPHAGTMQGGDKSAMASPRARGTGKALRRRMPTDYIPRKIAKLKRKAAKCARRNSHAGYALIMERGAWLEDPCSNKRR